MQVPGVAAKDGARRAAIVEQEAEKEQDAENWLTRWSQDRLKATVSLMKKTRRA